VQLDLTAGASRTTQEMFNNWYRSWGVLAARPRSLGGLHVEREGDYKAMLHLVHRRSVNMRAIGKPYLLSVIVAFLCPIPADAQPLFARTAAIETTVINSDHVFIAKILKIPSKNDEDKRIGNDAIISIVETLKAELFREEPYDKLNVYLPYRETEILGWLERSHRVLVALNSDNPNLNLVIELDPQTLEVMTADVKLLREPDAVIEAARAAVHRLPSNVNRVNTFDWIVPLEVVAETRWILSYRTGGYLLVCLPVDSHLEKRAQANVRAGDPIKRHEGIRALAYFQSDENLALVKPLLNDPHFSFFSRNNDSTGERYYPARHAAYQTLKAWGLEVERPVFREEVQ
jgi:hypothetical protein